MDQIELIIQLCNRRKPLESDDIFKENDELGTESNDNIDVKNSKTESENVDNLDDDSNNLVDQETIGTIGSGNLDDADNDLNENLDQETIDFLDLRLVQSIYI